MFICANDFVAGDLIRGLFSIGKTVPEDVRILGFDDAPESRIIRPALSTVHIHKRRHKNRIRTRNPFRMVKRVAHRSCY